ncbi:uncharacterized protein MONOS_12814 [Monocercomonoides exilis]|uniref:uncharacterized protein n=1 Tax=Monocercomonoides exilis TaxID=2049356 RepID=UPI0035598214|nr:hypothetical protein MONOS_12814 [Monocercomonoides exilis]|eukprot:MONOS_12814.1-p1 / transcript=MONOS_12814.1 / gene=MONOS_12814 / organism=Monocercomonoides_exilis_PA203 / gene_product=unspecified product / transcript_product=unspecified product / location=Mono_scaffold00737:16155-16661(-) / protein_length=169 / sequence_SO=supercontig / SO=protein_coding / is_pseudo=false
MLEKRVFERWRLRWIWRGEGEGEGEGKGKEEDEYEDEEDEGEGDGEEREKGEKRKDWMRETKEEKEECEMEKETGIGEWVSEGRLFGVEKRGKERMAGWWGMREKLVRERRAWKERKSGDFVAVLTWQVEERIVVAEWCWEVRIGQPVRGMMLRWFTHKEVLMIFKVV